MQWSLHVSPASLAENQRLQTSISANIDAKNIAKRRMIVYLRIQDHDGQSYCNSQELSVRPSMDVKYVNVLERAAVRPGDYEIAMAIYDPDLKEHSLKRAKLRVGELHRDPFPDAWRDLPAVEFSSDVPQTPSRLFLPLKTEKPTNIEIIVNLGLDPAKEPFLISRLKVASGMAVPNGSIHVTLLDLERQKIAFALDVANQLDWSRLNDALHENSPFTIDAQSLQNYKQNAQFFVSEIAKRLERKQPDRAAPVMIVLSAPRPFPKGQDLRPIQPATSQPIELYYIRCHLPHWGRKQPPIFDEYGKQLSGWDAAVAQVNTRPNMPPIGIPFDPANLDSLEQTLKPLHPRVFEVVTPADFRTALGAVISAIAHSK